MSERESGVITEDAAWQDLCGETCLDGWMFGWEDGEYHCLVNFLLHICRYLFLLPSGLRERDESDSLRRP